VLDAAARLGDVVVDALDAQIAVARVDLDLEHLPQSLA
jgi:hypothetical protein